jgi:hypothetical protein
MSNALMEGRTDAEGERTLVARTVVEVEQRGVFDWDPDAAVTEFVAPDRPWEHSGTGGRLWRRVAHRLADLCESPSGSR